MNLSLNNPKVVRSQTKAQEEIDQLHITTKLLDISLHAASMKISESNNWKTEARSIIRGPQSTTGATSSGVSVNLIKLNVKSSSQDLLNDL